MFDLLYIYSTLSPNLIQFSVCNFFPIQEWSEISGQLAQSESCSYQNPTGNVQSNSSQSTLPSNAANEVGLMAASPDSGLHSESNVTSEASYSSNEPLGNLLLLLPLSNLVQEYT
jgi:hypothetical protein